MSPKKILLLSLLLLCTATLWAVPARRATRLVEQPDGTTLALMVRGDEHFHYLVTEDGVPIVRHEGAYYYAVYGAEGFEASSRLAHDAEERTKEEQTFVESLPDIQQMATEQMQRTAARRRAATRAATQMPNSGKVNIPVLLVQYTDAKFSTKNPKTAFEERLNGENYTAEGGCGSIREYFVEQSGGQFEPHFDIIGPITLKNEMAYYGANNQKGEDLRPREMVKEACIQAYNDLGTDFKRYDNNKDGYVDIVYVIYAGYGEASYPDVLEETIWPHQWQLEKPHSLNGVLINEYACNNELNSYKGTTLDGIGTFCHEFSHCLGLPDYYDTSGGTAFGMSYWSVMDQGCYNNDGHTPCGYNAYEKDFLGWYSLKELDRPTMVTLEPLSEGGEAYKIVNDANPNEYYVVEYFDQKGWNRYAPTSGMVVMHIDYDAQAWYNNCVNNDPNHPRVTIIPADNKRTAQTLAGDVYPGTAQNTSLTATSRPAAKVYKGGYMNKDITNITAKNGAVTFAFMQDALLAPQVHTPLMTGPTQFTLTWDAVAEAEAYDVRLDLVGEDGSETLVRTERVATCSYTFEGLSGGTYRCRVRSIRQGISSHYSDAVEVVIDDSQLPSVGEAPRITISADSIRMEAADGAEIYYTLDGALPTIYSHRYTAPFATTEKVTVQAIAYREGYHNSDVAQLTNWFAQGGATYRLVSTAPDSVVVTEAPGGNGDEDYVGHLTFGDALWKDGTEYAFAGFDTGAFRYAMELRSVTVEDAMIEYVGDSLFHGCSALNAVVWDTPSPLPDQAFDEDSYRNLLVYLTDEAEVPTSIDGMPYVAVVKGGYCNELTLDASSNFYCPRNFTAGRVTYRRTFKQTTGLETSSGWETLVLPFDVQRIAHATKGDITPFGCEGSAHCWLATPDSVLVNATEIRANVPYLISFPNNEAYGDHSLAGSITFSAEEAEIYATPSPLNTTANSVTCALVPTYDRIEATNWIYALNVGSKYEGLAPGSVFTPGRYETPPFSVYMVVYEEKALPYYRIKVEANEEIAEANEPKKLSITSRDGYLYIESTEERTIQLYNAVGRLVQVVHCKVGTTMVGPLDKGIYIMEKMKIYVDC